MRHETLYTVLNTINTVILTFIGIPFLLQLIYMFTFWLKKKTYPKSEKKAKLAILIPAHNEAAVIYDTIVRIKERQTYPKDLYDIYVVCHNCSDNTAELVEKAGANAIIFNDPDPKRARPAFCIKHGFEYLLEHDKGYEFYIRLDADNHLNDEFLSLMNDAYQTGIDFARPYETALNMTQNNFSKACGLYYVFDSRFGSRARERLHISAHVNGPGSLISKKMLEDVGGYNTKTLSDDAEFMMLCMDKGYKGHFVEDAIVYEDFPATMSDTYKRNKRMGSGTNNLLWTKCMKLLGKFFITGRFSYIEVFLTYLMLPISVILCTWIPIFYVYDAIYLSLCGTGVIAVSTFAASYYMDMLWQVLTIAGIAISVLFVFCGCLQGFLLVMFDYKKMGAKKRSELMAGVLLFPAFSVVYIATIAIGACSRPKWGVLKRNVGASIDAEPVKEIEVKEEVKEEK